MVVEAEKYKAEDDAQKEKIEARNQLENFCCQVKNEAGEQFVFRLSSDEKQAFEKCSDETRRGERQHRQKRKNGGSATRRSSLLSRRQCRSSDTRNLLKAAEGQGSDAHRQDGRVHRVFLQQCDNNRKRKLLKNHEMRDEPVDAPARLPSAMQSSVSRSPRRSSASSESYARATPRR